LFKSSRQFQNYEEDEIDNNNFMKSTISIKTLYSRPKTGTRPGTTRGFGQNPIINSGDDYVDQCNFNEIDEMEGNNFESSEKENYDMVNRGTNKISDSNTNLDIVNNNNMQESQNMENNWQNVGNEINKVPVSTGTLNDIQENANDFSDVKVNEEINANKSNNNEEPEKSSGEAYEERGYEGVDEEIYGEDSREKKPRTESNKKTEKNEEEIIEENNSANKSKSNKSQIKNPESIKDEKENINMEELTNNLNNMEEITNVNPEENQKKEEIEKEKDEFNGMVSNMDNKMVKQNSIVDEAKDQFSDENIVYQKQSQMIDNNIQVEEKKIEEEYKDEDENMQIDMNMEMEMEEEQVSVFNLDARYPDDWNQGEFEVIINHCYDCHKHKTSTRHYEFVNIFILIYFFSIIWKNLMKLEVG
jgi:hypothetical protein